MANQIIIDFSADISKLLPAIEALEQLGQIDKKSAEIFKATNAEYQKRNQEVNKLSAAYTNLSEEVASGALKEHKNELNKQTEAIVKQVEQTDNLTKKLRLMIRELAAMKAAGKDNTEEFKNMSREAGKLQDDIEDARGQVRALASDTKKLDAVAQAFRGIAAGMSIATGASALFGEENEDLQKSLLKVQAAMAVLNGVQEVAALVTGQNALKTYILDGAQKAAAASAQWMGKNIKLATAAALGGVGLLITGIVSLVTYLNDATDKSNAFRTSLNKIGDTADLINKRIELIKGGLTEEVNAVLDIERKKRQLLIEFQTKRNNDLKAADNAFMELDSAEKIRFYGQYVRKREAIIESYQRSERLIIANYEREILAAKEKTNDKEVKQNKKKEEKIAKQRAQTIMEMLEMDEQYMEDRTAIGEKMFSEIMKLQADELRARQDMLDEMEAMQIAEINRVLQAEEDAAKQKQDFQKYIASETIASATTVSNALFEIDRNRQQANLDAQLSFLDKLRDAQLENQNLTDKQREAIERQYEDRRRKAQIEAWKSQQQAAIASGVINGALAVGNALATVKPFPAALVAAASVAVATAAQVAVIRSQPIPQFAEGTEFLEGAGTGQSDSIHAMLSRGERVVPARTNADYFDGLSVIQNRIVAPELVNTLLTNLAENGGMLDIETINEGKQSKGNEIIDYEKLGEIFKRSKSEVNINADINGFTVSIQKGLNRATYHNKKLRIKK